MKAAYMDWKRRVSARLRVAVYATLLGALAGCGSESQSVGPPPPPPVPGDGTSFQIIYSTFLGGSGLEEIREPLLLPDGRLLIGSRTLSRNMPVTQGVYQPAYGGGAGDSWLGILREDGSGLDAATYFGGSGMERPPYGIALAANGDVVFTSGTTSPDIPTTGQSYRSSLHQPVPSPGDGYVCRISADLATLRWCTYTGGGWPRGGLAVSAADEVWVAGRAVGVNFTTTPDAWQGVARGADDAFILQLDSDGGRALYSTRVGGSGNAEGESTLTVIVLPGGGILASGNSASADFPTTQGSAMPVSPGGRDGWALRLDGSNAVVYSTLVGGSRNDFIGHRGVPLPDGSLINAGATESSDLPGLGGARGGLDGYVAVVSADGTDVTFRARVGGSDREETLGPVLDPSGRVYLFGNTESHDFPVTEGALQTSFGGGQEDGYLTILSPDGSIEYSTYLGGSGSEMVRGVVIAPNGDVIIVGRTSSDDFPIVSAFQPTRGGDDDGFVIRLRRAN